MLKQDRILAIDIGASGVKLAEFVPLKSGGIEMVRYAVGSLGIDPQSDADRSTYISTTIRELMHETGIKSGSAFISVSGQSVFSRFVKLPPVDKEKVYQIILYEAQQNVPFPIDEVVWDYQLIGGAGGEIDVMLAAIKADIIQQLTDCVESVGLEPDLVDVAPMALYNAVRYNYPSLPVCTLVVDIGARSTDLIFIEEGRLFSRSIPVAGNAITLQIMHEFGLSFNDAEEMKRAHAYVAFGGAYQGPKSEVVDKVSKSVRSVMTRMHAEINRSINFYRSQQSGQAPQLILLTGGTSVIPYTDTFLKEKLKTDVDYLNPFLNVAVGENIAAEEIGQNAHLMGQVVGLALRGLLTCPIEINLMPPQVIADKAFRKKQPLFVMAAAGLILILLVWCGYYFKMTNLDRQRLDKVTERVSALEAVERNLKVNEQKIEQLRVNIDKMSTLVGRRNRWLEVLKMMHDALPDGMWMTAIKPIIEAAPPEAGADQKVVKAFEISGLGYLDKDPTGTAVIDFRDKLRGMSFISENTEITWRPTPQPTDSIQEFKIKIELKEPFPA